MLDAVGCEIIRSKSVDGSRWWSISTRSAVRFDSIASPSASRRVTVWKSRQNIRSASAMASAARPSVSFLWMIISRMPGMKSR